MAELTLSVEVAAPAEQAWAGAVDWSAQGEWMLGTRVWTTVQGGIGVGGGLAAFTGFGRLGFLDTMVITEWDPPRRCVVAHTGRVVRGSGVFEVAPTGLDSCRFVWSEQLDLPFGLLGRVGWAVVKAPFAAAVTASLRRFAARVQDGQYAPPDAGGRAPGAP